MASTVKVVKVEDTGVDDGTIPADSGGTDLSLESSATSATSNTVTFRASAYPARNPFDNTLYQPDGEYTVADIEDGSDCSKYLKVQLAAGVLVLV